ncbi:FkbM family methyltransferase [Pelagibacterales bacterium SAG-MED30]|nr:FkbM family methyltransferase [Pelagibacterales bacterium SAG-MED30]
MLGKLKNFIKNQFSYDIWHFFISNYQLFKFLTFKKYSARGNIDKSLMKIINKKKGFYLEIGAYNGISESISLRFEKDLKWSGLLIEPNPLHFRYLKKNRSKNICLNRICLSKKYLNKKLFIKNLNLMSHIVDDKNKLYFKDYPISRINNMAKEAKLGNFQNYKCKIEILENIFKRFKIKVVDLAIIDVEGSEMELLKGINFKKIKINYFCIESYNFKKLKEFMIKKKYKFLTKLHKEDYVFKRIS